MVSQSYYYIMEGANVVGSSQDFRSANARLQNGQVLVTISEREDKSVLMATLPYDTTAKYAIMCPSTVDKDHLAVMMASLFLGNL